jgi:UDP-glucose 4-epimerase
MQKVLVTGGAGFIGSHLVDALVARGVAVTVLDDLSTGKHENIAHHASGVTFIEGSVSDQDVVMRAVEGVDTIFHLAAVASVQKSIEHPLETHETNTTGTLAVFEAARKLSINKVVYASSSAVYGDLPDMPKTELSQCCPKTPYGLQKMIGEAYAKLYYELHGVKSIGFRCFNVYGSRQDASSPYSGVISLFAKLLNDGKQPNIYGDGTATRDFVHVSDVVEANLLAAESDINFDVFNIATGKEIAINELLQTMNTALGTDIAPVYQPERAGDIKRSVADISKAQKMLGWSPKMALQEGISELLRK